MDFRGVQVGIVTLLALVCLASVAGAATAAPAAPIAPTNVQSAGGGNGSSSGPATAGEAVVAGDNSTVGYGPSDNSTVGYRPSGVSTTLAAPGAPTIDVTYEVDRTPADVGRVTVTYTAEVPANVTLLSARFNRTFGNSIAVESATNMAYNASRGAWDVPSARGSTTTATLVYTAETNVTAGFGSYYTVETGDWAFVDARQLDAVHQWSYYGSNLSLDREYAVDGQGYASFVGVYLGPYTTYSDSGSNQSFTVVVPDAASPATPPGRLVGALTAAASELRVGDRDPNVTGMVLPDPIREGGRGGDRAFWVDENVTLGAESVWFHEYVHTRQAWTDSERNLSAAADVEWVSEAMGEYFGALLSLRTGNTDVESFRDHVATRRFASAVLQDANRVPSELPNYYKGRRVMAALDIRIRRHTEGKHTLDDVFAHLNSRPDPTFDYADLRGKVVGLTNASTGNWLDRYVLTSAAPSIPRNLATIYGRNDPPVADAGSDLTVAEGAAVSLSAANTTDPDGDALNYSWRQTGGPPVGLSGVASATPSFTAPTVTGNAALTFEVTVSDGLATDTDTVSVLVRDTNRPPVADAGDNRSVGPNTTVRLDAGNSTDPEGEPLDYAWRQTGGPAVGLAGAATATPSFTTPRVGNTTELTFAVTATDPDGATDTDTVTVRVAPSSGPFRSLGRTAPGSVTASRNATVTVRATLDATGGPFSINDAFAGPVADASVRSVTVDGTPASPVLAEADANGTVVTLASTGPGATVTVTYRIEAANRTGPITITGVATSGTQVGLETDVVQVQSCSLSPIASRYDADGDCAISVTELGQAGSDYAAGRISVTELGDVGAAYAGS